MNIFQYTRKHTVKSGIRIYRISMSIATSLMVILFIFVASASSFKLEHVVRPYTHIAFMMSLLLLLISIIPSWNAAVKQHRAFSLIIGIAISFLYAATCSFLSVSLFEGEDTLMALMLLCNYFLIVVKQDI